MGPVIQMPNGHLMRCERMPWPRSWISASRCQREPTSGNCEAGMCCGRYWHWPDCCSGTPVVSFGCFGRGGIGPALSTCHIRPSRSCVSSDFCPDRCGRGALRMRTSPCGIRSSTTVRALAVGGSLISQGRLKGGRFVAPVMFWWIRRPTAIFSSNSSGCCQNAYTPCLSPSMQDHSGRSGQSLIRGTRSACCSWGRSSRCMASRQ